MVKGLFTSGVKKEPMSDAVNKGKKYYRRTKRAIHEFLSDDKTKDEVGGVWSTEDFKE